MGGRSRISRSYPRDLQSLIAFSFIDTGANIGDADANHAGSLALLADFFRSGRFALSFAGRPKKTGENHAWESRDSSSGGGGNG